MPQAEVRINDLNLVRDTASITPKLSLADIFSVATLSGFGGIS
jgi:hypothetical protein